MAIVQHTSVNALDTPLLGPVSLPRIGPSARHSVLHPSLTPTGSLRWLQWVMTRPVHPDAVNDDWDAPASFPNVPEMNIWIHDWQQSVVVHQTKFSFVTVRDVLKNVHDAAQRVQKVDASGSNQTEPASLLFSNDPAPQVTAYGWRWAGLTASIHNDEEWVLAVVF